MHVQRQRTRRVKHATEGGSVGGIAQGHGLRRLDADTRAHRDRRQDQVRLRADSGGSAGFPGFTALRQSM